jgi:hypothetical protein
VEQRLLKFLKAIRLKKAEMRADFKRPPANKMAKLKGAEEVILAVLDDNIVYFWEELKL